LGIRIIASDGSLEVHAPLQMDARSPQRAFWESATVEILNPKTAIFYVAFLPQFTDVGATVPLWGQLLILGTCVNLLFSSADLLCVLLAERINVALRRSSRVSKWANRMAGGLLIALGLNLATGK